MNLFNKLFEGFWNWFPSDSEDKFNPNYCECLHSNWCEECYKESLRNKKV